MTVNPYNTEESKKEQVRQMFNNISGRYDFLNHFLSMGIDKVWRNKAVSLLKNDNPKKILDIATGTGDFAIACLKVDPDHVTGIDISEKMLDVGREKVSKLNLSEKIQLLEADSESLPFEDDTFDAAVVGFGVRNFENLEKGLKEIHRVLKHNAKFVVLEFSKPNAFPIKQIYGFYFSKILPGIGALVSKDKRAYTYLNESVSAFPEGDDYIQIMEKCGFKSLEYERLMLGIATIYVGKK